MKEIQAVFIDRDGTIGGTGHFIHPNDFQLFDGVAEAIEKLRQAGIKIFAFTNQHRISRNQATKEEFAQQFKDFGFDDWFICPHSDNDACLCKKPKPGMLLEAAQRYSLDLSKCVVIGDVGSTDMLAAHAVGAMKILVKTGWGNDSLLKYRDKWAEARPDYVADDFIKAVDWILDSKLTDVMK